MADRKIVNVISSQNIPCWGNQKKYIAIHYLGVDGQSYQIGPDGCGAHFYIYWDGTIYQRCSLDAVPWAVGTAGYYRQIHPEARNMNTISIEMCCHNTGGDARSAEDPHWWFTTETQEACVWLVQKLMKELNIPISNVLRHGDITSKLCPNPYILNNRYRTSWTWDEFKAKVAAGTDSDTLYRIRKDWDKPFTQTGAYKSLKEAKKACEPGYSVYDANGKEVYYSPVFSKKKRYKMNLSMALRKEPKANAEYVMFKDIPAAKQKYFKEGKNGEALIKKGTVDKCYGEKKVGTRGIYMKVLRGWILAQLNEKDRVTKVK